MDSIFRNAKGWFSVVKIAREQPRRYGKSGELLIQYDETEEHARRQASVGGVEKGALGGGGEGYGKEVE